MFVLVYVSARAGIYYAGDEGNPGGNPLHNSKDSSGAKSFDKIVFVSI